MKRHVTLTVSVPSHVKAVLETAALVNRQRVSKLATEILEEGIARRWPKPGRKKA